MEKFETMVDKTSDIIKQLEHNLELIEEDVKLCRNAKKYLKDYKTNYLLNNQKGVNNSIKKLNEIDKEIISINIELSLLATVFTKIVYEIENNDDFLVKASDSKNKAFNKELNRSQELYSKMQDILNIYYKDIKKTVNELKEGC
jgi:Mg2+ and Co2+ transporter CorA